VLTAIGEVLPVALALMLATSPVVVIALVLVTRRPLALSRAFVSGWLLGLFSVGAVVLLLADVSGAAGGGFRWAPHLKIVLGAVLVVLAVRKWLGRPRAGDEPAVPTWMAGIDTITPRRAFTVAYLLGSVNPKNLVLTISGAAVIAEATAQPARQFVALTVFVLVGSLAVAAPSIASGLLGQRAAPALAAANAWLTRYSAVVMALVLLAIGAVLIADGVAGL